MSETRIPALLPLDAISASLLDDMYRTERPSLLRRLAKRTGLDQAEDVVHQVFARLAGRGPAIMAIETPAAFLAEAARNAERDMARSAHRRFEDRHVALEEAEHIGIDPVALLEARDRLVRIEQALDRLKPLTRNVFLARRLDGYSYAEIAEQTGLSVRGVEKQMSRAIQQLSRHLRES